MFLDLKGQSLEAIAKVSPLTSGTLLAASLNLDLDLNLDLFNFSKIDGDKVKKGKNQLKQRVF